MFKNICGWNPQNIQEYSAAVHKLDVLIYKECTCIDYEQTKLSGSIFDDDPVIMQLMIMRSASLVIAHRKH